MRGVELFGIQFNFFFFYKSKTETAVEQEVIGFGIYYTQNNTF